MIFISKETTLSECNINIITNGLVSRRQNAVLRWEHNTPAPNNKGMKYAGLSEAHNNLLQGFWVVFFLLLWLTFCRHEVSSLIFFKRTQAYIHHRQAWLHPMLIFMSTLHFFSSFSFICLVTAFEILSKMEVNIGRNAKLSGSNFRFSEQQGPLVKKKKTQWKCLKCTLRKQERHFEVASV